MTDAVWAAGLPNLDFFPPSPHKAVHEGGVNCSMITTPIGIAVVGYGYWGPNIARNVVERSEFRMMGLCELDPARAESFSQRYPGVTVESDLDTLLLDPRVEAVAIATPPRTHYNLVRRALLAGKHVLVEKPLATEAVQAEELIQLAAQMDRVLMPGHTFVYSPPVNKVRELIHSGQLGDVYFITSSRMNLGLYQSDGVISDLAPHDLSILLYWLDKPVTQIAVAGQSIFRQGVPETAFLTVTFAGGTTANVQISWLAPRKMRQMVVVGSKRMVQYEDTSADESVRVYDRGLDVSMAEAPATFGEYQLTYRSGDIVTPRIEAAEPLGLELADFANSIHTGEEPRSNSRLGLEIVRALEAAHLSMDRLGDPIKLDGSDRLDADGALLQTTTTARGSQLAGRTPAVVSN
ncbi:MAG TPA: Gfo/Idh/MocA family oxidoreductase [Solirubrobacteraceae bacterium]|nr:Gfo/Idh/MocA family oxidoreductase [Solirubrobacteraceae bacterium]